jgi:glycosyltransferase involved in cell wall biosynthesis
MPADPVRVLVVTPADPAALPIGGIATFLAGMIRFAPADFEFAWVGLTGNTTAHPIGRWTHATVEGRRVDVFPLLTTARGAPRARIPISLRFGAQLMRSSALPALQGRILQFHRPGVGLPLLRREVPKVQVWHLDPLGVVPGGGESRWRHSPWLFRWAEDRVIRGVDAIFAVNERVVDALRTRYPAAAVHFLPNWYDPDVFHPPPEDAPTAEEPLVLLVGRLELTKDPALALEAFLRLQAAGIRARLAVVGDGSLRRRLEMMAARRPGGERVDFLGHLPRDDVAALMRSAHALVISSRSEAGPTVAVEALASGLPVVSPAVGRVAEVVRHGASGWIAPERTAEALADGLRWALATPAPTLRAAATEAAWPYRADVVLEPFYEVHRALAARAAER